MGEGNLSQEEIDKLLRMSQMDEGEQEEPAVSDGIEAGRSKRSETASLPHAADLLSEDHLDALGEFFNIAMGKAATVLSSILEKSVSITTPSVSIESWESLKSKHPVPSLLVIIEYIKGLEGSNLLVVTQKDANIIANVMDEEDVDLDQPLDDYRQGVLGEAMNQMMGGAVVSITEMLNRDVEISPPSLFLLDLGSSAASLENPFSGDLLVQISFRFEVEDLVKSEMLQVMSLDFANRLAQEIMADIDVVEGGASIAQQPPEEVAASPNSQLDDDNAPVQVKKAEFQPLAKGNGNGEGEKDNLQLIMDIEVEVSVELGRARMKIKDVLALGEGSVIELDKLVGEPIEVYANNRLIARGEVVVVEEDFGVRITEIVKKRDVQSVTS